MYNMAAGGVIHADLLCRFLFPDLPEEGGLIPEPTTNLQDKKEPGSIDPPLESPKPG